MADWAGETAFVSGATGFTGGVLARRLVAEGARVRALVRSLERAAPLRALGVETIAGDLSDEASVRAAMEDCTLAFHTAISYGTPAQQQAINVGGARLVANAAADAGVRRLVHVSSIAVYGVAQPGNVTEATPLAPGGGAYSVTKAEQETVIRRIAAARGLSFAFSRPGFIYGAGSDFWTAGVFRWARLRPTPLIGTGDGFAHAIHVDDVVDQLLMLARHPNADGQAFNCAPDPAPMWREWLAAYARLIDARPPQTIAVPPILLHAIAGVGMMIAPRGSNARELPDYLTFLQRRRVYKMTKSREVLGWHPRVSITEGVASTAAWLRTQGLLS